MPVLLVLFLAFILIGGYLSAKKKAKANETSITPYARRAGENWKRATTMNRFLALTTAGITPENAERMKSLAWYQLPENAQLALIKFQMMLEIDPDAFSVKE